MAQTLSLLFPKRLYTGAGVKKAVKTFSEDAELNVEKTDEGYLVTGNPFDPEALEELTDELANTALYYTIEARKKF